MSEIKITWKKSYIGRNRRQRRVIEALGLKRLSHSVVHMDTPTIRGMVEAVSHMLEVEAVPEAAPPKAPRARRPRAKQTGQSGQRSGGKGGS